MPYESLFDKYSYSVHVTWRVGGCIRGSMYEGLDEISGMLPKVGKAVQKTCLYAAQEDDRF